MVFPSYTLKYVNDSFRMEYHQRVIIKFLWNEGPMPAKLQPECNHSLLKMFINFEQSNSGLERYSEAVKTCMIQFAKEDRFWMMLMGKFWLS
jgi:hypothetical protein